MTTLRIDDKVNRRLEEFLAQVLLRWGIKIDKKTFVEKAILRAIRDQEFIRELVGNDLPLENDPAWTLLDKPKKWGVEDASTKIDEYLYG
ncbi:MAG: hypothetical protein Q6363_006530 [Candidatus Njordarchaeota archaeon]